MPGPSGFSCAGVRPPPPYAVTPFQGRRISLAVSSPSWAKKLRGRFFALSADVASRGSQGYDPGMSHISLLVALLACRTAPQEKAVPAETKQKIEATVKETQEKERPGFLCEGTAELADDCRIDVEIFFGKPDADAPIQNLALAVRGGRFAAPFSFYKEKNLAGLY